MHRIQTGDHHERGDNGDGGCQIEGELHVLTLILISFPVLPLDKESVSNGTPLRTLFVQSTGGASGCAVPFRNPPQQGTLKSPCKLASNWANRSGVPMSIHTPR